jgi:hypothetical protein
MLNGVTTPIAEGRAVEYGNRTYPASRYSFDLTLTGW